MEINKRCERSAIKKLHFIGIVQKLFNRQCDANSPLNPQRFSGAGSQKLHSQIHLIESAFNGSWLFYYFYIVETHSRQKV